MTHYIIKIKHPEWCVSGIYTSYYVNGRWGCRHLATKFTSLSEALKVTRSELVDNLTYRYLGSYPEIQEIG